MSRAMRMVTFMTGMGLKSKRLDETPKRKSLLKRDWEQTGNIYTLQCHNILQVQRYINQGPGTDCFILK